LNFTCSPSTAASFKKSQITERDHRWSRGIDSQEFSGN